MIDLHTHLLPGWDDGAPDVAEAARMAEAARADGITTIVLTPHVFRREFHRDDLNGLWPRVRDFLGRSAGFPAAMRAGAEVHIHPEMIPRIRAFNLTIHGSSYVFIEFPPHAVPAGAKGLIFRMQLHGLIPIVCHPERNAVFAGSPSALFELIRRGALAQVNAASLTGGFGRNARAAAERFLKLRLVQMIASDAHDSIRRPPRLARAVERARRILDAETAEAMVTFVPEAILKNEAIPDLGDPVDPSTTTFSLFRRSPRP